MDGLKREPSSLNQFTTAMLNRGCPAGPAAAHCSTSRNAAWAAASTPYAPS